MERKYVIMICIAVVLAIALLIMFILISYDSLIANEVSVFLNKIGLDYNGISVNVNFDKLYTVGNYYLGVGHHFIKFDLSLQSLAFSTTDNSTILARTSVILSIIY
jgi:hypothetical protein